jgi:hypothetical protein
MGFMVFSPPKRKRFFCPYCGEIDDVKPYTKKEYQPKHKDPFWSEGKIARVVTALNAGMLMKEVAAELSTKDRRVSAEAVKKQYRKATGVGIHAGRRRVRELDQ